MSICEHSCKRVTLITGISLLFGDFFVPLQLMKRASYIFLIVLMLAACGGWRDGQRLLDRADSLLYGQPDSALRLLDSITEDDQERMSEAQLMRYHLLRADAQNKCFVPFTTDSVMKEVAHYYERKGTPNEQMRAFYLLGRAYYDMGELPQAMESFLTAEEHADTSLQSCDYKTLCRIHSQKAKLFYTQYLPKSSLEELRKACRYALLDHDSLTYLLCFEQKNRAFLQLHEIDSVLEVCEYVNKCFLRMGENVRAARTMSTSVHFFIQKGDFKKAEQLIHDYSTTLSNAAPLALGSLYSQKGDYFLALHQYDSAITNYRRLYELNSNLENVVLGSQGLYLSYKGLGIADSTWKYMEIYCSANDSSNIFNSARIMQEMESSYRYERNLHLSELKSEQLKTRNAVIVSIIILLVLVLALSLHKIRKNQREASMKLREENRKYLKVLSEYDKTRKEVQTLKSNMSDVTKLLEQKEQNEKTLLRQVASFHADSIMPTEWDVNDVILSQDPIPLLHKYAANGTQLTSDEDIRQLLSLVRKTLPSFLEEIERRGGNLKQIQRLVCILVKLRFLPSEICVLLNMSSSSLSNMRKRLLKRLFDENGNASVFDERIRSLRPDYGEK